MPEDLQTAAEQLAGVLRDYAQMEQRKLEHQIRLDEERRQERAEFEARWHKGHQAQDKALSDRFIQRDEEQRAFRQGVLTALERHNAELERQNALLERLVAMMEGRS